MSQPNRFLPLGSGDIHININITYLDLFLFDLANFSLSTVKHDFRIQSIVLFLYKGKRDASNPC